MKRGIQDPESIGDHMYRMGLMALISSDIPGVNRDKLGLFICLLFSYLNLRQIVFFFFVAFTGIMHTDSRVLFNKFLILTGA